MATEQRTDRNLTVLMIGVTGLVALLAAAILYAMLLIRLADIEPTSMAVFIGGIAGLVGLAGTALGLLAPSPLAKSGTADDAPMPVTVENTSVDPAQVEIAAGD